MNYNSKISTDLLTIECCDFMKPLPSELIFNDNKETYTILQT